MNTPPAQASGVFFKAAPYQKIDKLRPRRQIEQCPIVSAGEGLVEPAQQLSLLDFASLSLGQDERAHQDPAASFCLTLPLRLNRALASIDVLLTTFELCQLLLQCRNLLIEFGHEKSAPGG